MPCLVLLCPAGPLPTPPCCLTTHFITCPVLIAVTVLTLDYPRIGLPLFALPLTYLGPHICITLCLCLYCGLNLLPSAEDHSATHSQDYLGPGTPFTVPTTCLVVYLPPPDLTHTPMPHIPSCSAPAQTMTGLDVVVFITLPCSWTFFFYLYPFTTTYTTCLAHLLFTCLA